MIKRFFLTALVLLAGQLGAAAPQAQSPFESTAVPAPRTKIDELVLAKLKRLGIQPAHLCTDAVFLRRAYLDVIGTLPTAQEAKEFLASQDPNKRGALIDRLLERDEFADYWGIQYCNIYRQ